jgi:hypothetical protein
MIGFDLQRGQIPEMRGVGDKGKAKLYSWLDGFRTKDVIGDSYHLSDPYAGLLPTYSGL